jgi:hypothetical protein
MEPQNSQLKSQPTGRCTPITRAIGFAFSFILCCPFRCAGGRKTGQERSCTQVCGAVPM